jgi:hypothetical protein
LRAVGSAEPRPIAASARMPRVSDP